jgi:hypothetical protein
MLNNVPASLANLLEHPGKVYPTVVAVTLIAVIVVIILHLILALLGGRAPRARKRFNWWEKLVYLGALASVSVLGVTSFYTVLRFGGMHGWWLFAHMFGAGALTAVLPLAALTWCGASRFGQSGPQAGDAAYVPRFFWLPRVMFWLFLVAGLGVMLTMLVSMLPLFGTEGLEILLDIHRYAGLLAVVALLIHFYCVLLQRAQLR